MFDLSVSGKPEPYLQRLFDRQYIVKIDMIFTRSDTPNR